MERGVGRMDLDTGKFFFGDFEEPGVVCFEDPEIGNSSGNGFFLKGASGSKGEAGEFLDGGAEFDGAEFFFDAFIASLEKVVKTVSDQSVGMGMGFPESFELKKERFLEVACKDAGRIECLKNGEKRFCFWREGIEG